MITELPIENESYHHTVTSGIRPLHQGDYVAYELMNEPSGHFLYIEKGRKMPEAIQISLYRDRRTVKIMPLYRRMILNLEQLPPGRYTVSAGKVEFFRFEITR